MTLRILPSTATHLLGVQPRSTCSHDYAVYSNCYVTHCYHRATHHHFAYTHLSPTSKSCLPDCMASHFGMHGCYWAVTCRTC
ncbi:uncharacterized protein B0H18DRAFT_1036357 [Fomitopsis serialis]|uniref:uncharacterized protein n=1 Tax=Fomitopsis serialis TaxID=139415 RepID=UPI002008C687|nr:uncharacterized protein B0H18DRAFT_1036357 [Neoantrodia serialis]KAH9917040.1 hypothetical protein B0H18DRAFT_1036357 [Neoantrodia serialis]